MSSTTPSTGYQVVVGHKTHEGARGKKNDDSYATFTADGSSGRLIQMAVAADGVTSTGSGEQASQLAVNVVRDYLKNNPTGSINSRMGMAIREANAHILDRTAANPELKGMSTTIVLAAIDGDRLFVSHLGDSRVYLIRSEDEAIFQLTRDHTWVQEALEHNRIDVEEAKIHPNRHVIRQYLGSQRSIPVDQEIIYPGEDIYDIDSKRTTDGIYLQAGDSILLCTDGLFGTINDHELNKVISANRTAPQKAIEDLIDIALQRGEADNITGVLLETPGAKKPAPVSRSKGRTLVPLALFALVVAAALLFLFQSRNRGTDGLSETVAVTEAVADGSESDSASTEPSNGEPAAADVSSGAAAQTVTEPTPVPIAASGQESPTAILVGNATAGSTVISVTVISATVISTAVENVAQNPQATLVATPVPYAQRTQAAQLTQIAQLTETAQTSATQMAGVSAATPTSTSVATATTMQSNSASLTSTPAPTNTPPPTSTSVPPTPTPTTATTTATTAPIAQPASNLEGTIELIKPLEPTLRGTQIFEWRSSEPLPEGQWYELIFWEPGQDPFVDGFSPIGAKAESTVQVNLEKAAADLPQFSGGKQYLWGVRLVRVDPFVPIAFLGEGSRFTFELTNGGNNSENNTPDEDNSGGREQSSSP